MEGTLVRRASVLAATVVLASVAVTGSVAANSYEKVPGPATWAEARDASASAGGPCGSHLVTITSAAEQAEIHGQLGNDIAFAWLGGEKVGGAWQWVTGEAWNYTNWQPGEPSGDGPLLMVGGGGSSSDPWVYDGKWNDTPARTGPYIVEFEDCPPPYDFDGFYQPVDNNAMNVAKAGSAIPVKFSLGGNEGLDIFRDSFPKVAEIGCSTGEPNDVVETTVDAAKSVLKYDAASGQYVYVWKSTKNMADGCYRFKLGLKDLSGHTFDVRLK